MEEGKPKRKTEQQQRKQLLPLVVEIIPGHAAEGLIDIYEPGTYEGKTLHALCSKTLAKKTLSIEEIQVLEDIQRQLEGGKLLCQGKEIHGMASTYSKLEQTEAGEEYLYVPVRAIKPQEGGCMSTWKCLNC